MGCSQVYKLCHKRGEKLRIQSQLIKLYTGKDKKKLLSLGLPLNVWLPAFLL